MQRFHSRYKGSEPKMLAIFLNVGRFSDDQNNITRNITFIGEHYNDSKNGIQHVIISLPLFHKRVFLL